MDCYSQVAIGRTAKIIRSLPHRRPCKPKLGQAEQRTAMISVICGALNEQAACVCVCDRLCQAWRFARLLTQDLLAEELGEIMLEHAMNGFNNCIFAYGQTGSTLLAPRAFCLPRLEDALRTPKQPDLAEIFLVLRHSSQRLDLFRLITCPALCRDIHAVQDAMFKESFL